MTKSVLIVEDEREILAILRRFLVKSGFEVIEARSVSEAVCQIDRCENLDLAVVDFWLNGEGAVSILDRMCEVCPRTPVIVISGGGNLSIEATHAVAALSGVSGFLQKPFRRGDLLALVDRLLT